MAFRKIRLAVCGLVAITVAEIVPSNQSTAVGDASGVFELQSNSGTSQQNLSQLVPLTEKAARKNAQAPPMLNGPLYNTNTTSVANITNQAVAYISCDTKDYPGNINAEGLLQQAWSANNLTAAIFYSTTSDYCAYNNPPSPIQDFSIFSMNSKVNSASVLDAIDDLPPSQIYFTFIRHFDTSEGQTNNSNQQNNNNQQNPLGPSPSTAVAMIILYSITGIITALFLVIIITGAVRAHRHPDRYGPRDVLGRPRQSRARGLGRAILDTIPIVKFGEREPAKPTDVELGSTSETRNAEANSNSPGAEHHHEGAESQSPETREDAPGDGTADEAGIAPAQPMAAGGASGQDGGNKDEGLGCSICTDDFEKGQDIRVLPCDHKFHPECVDPWLLNVSGTCPLCRVDLRPTTSHTSNEGDDRESLAPPLQPEAEASTRRRSALRDILSLRSRPHATTEERISALRRLREQRHNQSGEAVSQDHLNANASSDDVAAVRRSRRISARLQDVFSVRTRRNGQENPIPQPSTEASSSNVIRSGTEDPDVGGDSNSDAHNDRREDRNART